MRGNQLLLRFQRWREIIGEPPLQQIDHSRLKEKNVDLRVLRTDLVHPVISGNKAYKLKYNLDAAIQQQATGVLSFGGAWSNHLHALAYSCYQLQLPCVAVIRGEPELILKSAMLQDVKRWGCLLHFVSRKEYRLREEADWLQKLSETFPGYFIVPEGGSSPLAEPGVAELSHQLEQACQKSDGGEESELPDQVWCAVGTGGTLAGLLAGRKKPYHLLGVPVLKRGDFLWQQIADRFSAAGDDVPGNWSLLLDGHGGGYGKVYEDLLNRMASLETALSSDCVSLPLEPVYTGKLFLRFWQALENGELPEGSRVVLVHTGGLQGRRGYGLPWSSPDA